MKSPALISKSRGEFHAELLRELLSISADGVPNIADVKNATSILISRGMISAMGGIKSRKLKAAGQTSGKNFEELTARYLKNTFLRLDHLRPGSWDVLDRKSNTSLEISNFEQYSHIAQLVSLIEREPQLSAALGADYLITPDVVVIRRPEPEEFINRNAPVADGQSARLTPLRAINFPAETHTVRLLHASVSCKWTLRSDRAQNARSEALNLIRNRKGRVPHIVAVTAEPLPSRLASLALGTSDLDCVYHIALKELQEAVSSIDNDAQSEQLNTLIEGKRLRDIADLPLDLAI
jgi:hypothetical protein